MDTEERNRHHEQIERIYKRDVVTVIDAGPKAREEYGELWGSQEVRLTAEQLQALCAGKQLAINVMDEYLLFVEGREKI